MEQIIKHFTPAMTAFVVGILLIALLVGVLADGGIVSQQMKSLFEGFFQTANGYLP